MDTPPPMNEVPGGPRVSVIINNYNYGKYLADAIRSVLNQSYRNIEILCVDDGSTDDSRAVAGRFADQVRCLFKENGGQASALNAGVAASTGELICFLDSDDTWTPDKLQRVVEVFVNNPNVGWVRHKLTVADSQLTPSGAEIPSLPGSGPFKGNAYHYLERQTMVSTSALCLRRTLALSLFPIPVSEPGRPAGGGGSTLSFDADAYLSSLMFPSPRDTGVARSAVGGYSLNESLGLYRRHGQQQYKNRDDIIKMIRRQAAVGLIVSRAWSGRVGKDRTSSTVFKHQLIAQYMESGSTVSTARLGTFARGLVAIARMALPAPLLSVRQTAALGYAFCMPRRWLGKVLRQQGF